MKDQEHTDGGPAFPVPTELWEAAQDDYRAVECTGMSLRDYFAAAVLTAFYKSSSDGSVSGVRSNNRFMADRAYEMADAMLKARL